MYWNKQPLEYDICIPPLTKPFCELSHKEAEVYFQWHMSHLTERIDYLSSVVSEALFIPKSDLNLTPLSLIPIWTWFLSTAKTERTPEKRLKELEKQHGTYSEMFNRYLMDQSKEQFSLETEYVLRDIGMYLGEVFVKNEPSIYWSFYEKPKRDFFVNMPVLLGFEDSNYSPPFKTEFEPIHMSRVQASRIWDNRQKSEDLYNLYCKWVNLYVPQSTV